MRLLEADFAGPIAGYAGAALLCSMLTQWLSARESEIYSEILCWATLPVLVTYQKPPRPESILGPVASGESKIPTPPRSSMWMVAGSVAIFSFFKTEIDAIRLLPALSPLLLAYQKYLGSISKPPVGLLSPIASTIWGTALVASLDIFIFSAGNIQESLFSVIPTAALLIVYAILFPRNGPSSLIPSINVEYAIRSLSIRIIILLSLLLGIDAISFGLIKTGVTTTVVVGLLKALSWYFVIRVARVAPWSVAPLIGTFSIASTSNPSNKSSDLQAAAYLFVSVISLGQLVSLLPKQAKLRLTLWAFGLISLIPFLLNLWMIRATYHSAKIFGPQREHPVEALVRNGRITFENLLKRQSQSYKEAVEEYRRRYSVEPPPGFEAWYEFAVHHQSPIIDDFDAIHHAVSPIWRISGQRVLEIMNQIYFVPNSEMWFCNFYGRYATTRCIHPSRIYDRHLEYQFDSLLKNLKGVLPDVQFLFNHFDEPRILIPEWAGEDAHSNQQLNARNMSRQPIWDEITKFCAFKKKTNATQLFDLPFVVDRSSAIDLCEHPEYHNLHGLFISPVSFSLVEGLVPALSTGSLSTMGDILFPSPAYTELEFTYDDAREVDWDAKRNNLHWAGSTTGGFASDANWSSYHRQRFVKLAQNIERQQHYYLRNTGGMVQRIASSFLNGRLFDVAFTRIFQCEKRYCRDQKRYFKVGGWEDKDRAFRSRLVFDLDGNGISGRYYKLLASKSAPLKQTLLREWHDDRLVPWVHYIPVSQSLEELPELISHLTSTEAGQRHAREIAEQGRVWFFKALREADMAVYIYRLLLELARLQDPSRAAGSPAAG